MNLTDLSMSSWRVLTVTMKWRHEDIKWAEQVNFLITLQNELALFRLT